MLEECAEEGCGGGEGGGRCGVAGWETNGRGKGNSDENDEPNRVKKPDDDDDDDCGADCGTCRARTGGTDCAA